MNKWRKAEGDFVKNGDILCEVGAASGRGQGWGADEQGAWGMGPGRPADGDRGGARLPSGGGVVMAGGRGGLHGGHGDR